MGASRFVRWAVAYFWSLFRRDAIGPLVPSFGLWRWLASGVASRQCYNAEFERARSEFLPLADNRISAVRREAHKFAIRLRAIASALERGSESGGMRLAPLAARFSPDAYRKGTLTWIDERGESERRYMKACAGGTRWQLSESLPVTASSRLVAEFDAEVVVEHA